MQLSDCDLSNATTTVCKNHFKAILSTLEEFLSTKRTDYSKLRSDLTVGPWTAMISPACLTRKGLIFTFSPLSAESIHLLQNPKSVTDDNATKYIRQSHWDQIKSYWKIIENRTVVGISEKTVFIRGRVFMTQGDNGNIGHSIQRQACDMAAAIGAKVGPFDGIMNRDGTCIGIVSLILTAVADAIAVMQQPAPLAQMDWSVSNGVMCFEQLMFQKPNACGAQGLYDRPANQNETLKLVRSVLFKRLKLPRMSISVNRRDRSRCIKNILLYGRGDAHRRRLLNVGTIKTSLEMNKCLNVTLVNSWARSAPEQARLINSMDAMIMPHSAAIYASLFLPDFAWLMEIGKKSWIRVGLIPALPFSYHYINFGLDLLPYNAKIDKGVFGHEDQSFSVNSTTIEFIRSIAESHACEC